MPENERHAMVRVWKNSDGVEEWHCPVCGRHFLMQWPPNFKRTILEPGDENAVHVGGKGEMGLGMSMAEVDLQPAASGDSADLTPQEEERLSPWQQWMSRVGFDSLWDAA